MSVWTLDRCGIDRTVSTASTLGQPANTRESAVAIVEVVRSKRSCKADIAQESRRHASKPRQHFPNISPTGASTDLHPAKYGMRGLAVDSQRPKQRTRTTPLEKITDGRCWIARRPATALIKVKSASAFLRKQENFSRKEMVHLEWEQRGKFVRSCGKRIPSEQAPRLAKARRLRSLTITLY